MSTQLQLRRGTTAQHSTFTGASGEITIDTDKKTVVVHDGTTAGGRALPQFDSSGNLGIGVTPSAWNSNYRALEFSFGCVGGNASGVETSLLSNCYRAADGKYYYKKNGYAAQLVLNDGSGNTTSLFYASNGTAGTKVNSGTGDMTAAWTVDGSGNLLVGTTSTFSSNFRVHILVASGTGGIVTRAQGTGSTPMSFQNSAGTEVGYISTSNTTTTYGTSSDYRLKEDIQPVATPIDRLNQLKPVNFAWKLNGERCDGFLAHELQEVIPEAATGTKDETKVEEYEVTPAIKDEEGNVITEAVMGEREVPVYQGIDQSKIVPLLTAALQEAVAKIESLTQRIEALEYTKQGE